MTKPRIETDSGEEVTVQYRLRVTLTNRTVRHAKRIRCAACLTRMGEQPTRRHLAPFKGMTGTGSLATLEPLLVQIARSRMSSTAYAVGSWRVASQALTLRATSHKEGQCLAPVNRVPPKQGIPWPQGCR